MKKILLLLVLVISLNACKKKDVVNELVGTPVAGNGLVDVLWTLDKPHGSVCWESNYLDYSVGKLTGRFNNYGFSPKFIFDEANLSNCKINAWVTDDRLNLEAAGNDPALLQLRVLIDKQKGVDNHMYGITTTAWREFLEDSLDIPPSIALKFQAT